MQKVLQLFYLPILIIFGITAVLYFKFTAEDAYITFRYAENLINTGSLVYNIGEPINAATSPLHVLLSAVLFKITGTTILSNKIFALLLLIASVLLVWRQFKDYPQLQVIAISLMLLPPCILVWTFGGLETPILFFLVTLITTTLYSKTPLNISRLCLAFFLGGLIFLTRYDAALFVAPLLLYAMMKTKSIKSVSIAVVIGAIVPASWMVVSLLYYRDIFPTSFYLKAPYFSLRYILRSAVYISFYLFYIGITPSLLTLFLLYPSTSTMSPVISGHIRRLWWLYLGIILELIYGLTMATHHMMFSFRSFVPYIPAAVIAIIDLFCRTDEIDISSRKSTGALVGLLTFLVLFQLAQIIYTYKRSVNGITVVGEYKYVSLRDYVTCFMATLQKEAENIRQHWDSIKEEKNRRPRILTYAAGILPYTFRDSYIYEFLVSYRHGPHCNLKLSSDYLHILAPRHGLIYRQLPLPREHYQLISDYEIMFDGSVERFLVFYNPTPETHKLGSKIHEGCSEADDTTPDDYISIFFGRK